MIERGVPEPALPLLALPCDCVPPSVRGVLPEWDYRPKGPDVSTSLPSLALCDTLLSMAHRRAARRGVARSVLHSRKRLIFLCLSRHHAMMVSDHASSKALHSRYAGLSMAAVPARPRPSPTPDPSPSSFLGQ